MEKIQLKITMDTLSLATQLSEKSDSEQAELINFFAKRLKVSCNDDDLTGAQICSIASNLDNDGIRLIQSLCEFIDLSSQLKDNK